MPEATKAPAGPVSVGTPVPSTTPFPRHPPWAVYGLGERAPRAPFDHPDLARLAAVPAAVLERAGAILMDEVRRAG